MASEEPGQFMVKFADQNESSPENVFNAATAVISGAAKTAPTGATATAIPYTHGGLMQNVGCNGRVLVYFKAAATDIIESEESQWEIPILLYSGKQLVDSMILTQENMTGFTQAGTVDVTATANLPVRLAYWDVPRGLTAVLDPNGKIRAYLGDDS